MLFLFSFPFFPFAKQIAMFADTEARVPAAGRRLGRDPLRHGRAAGPGDAGPASAREEGKRCSFGYREEYL